MSEQMPEIIAIVRDRERSVHDGVSEQVARCIVAGLSADPDTIDELEYGLARFTCRKSAARDFFSQWKPGEREGSGTSGALVIDLAARLIVWTTRGEPIEPGGIVVPIGEPNRQTVNRSYDLSTYWQISSTISNWHRRAEQRRRLRESESPVDVSAAIYDDLVPYLAGRCIEESNDLLQRRVVAIHRDWLSTPRASLHDNTPRAFLLADYHHITTDIEDRARQWECGAPCPPGLSVQSYAYRHLGFGTHEWIMYYDLVRHLINEGLTRVERDPTISELNLRRDLVVVRDQWLRTPIDGPGDFCPAQVIHSERQRIPLTVSGEARMADDDCPLCQMLADQSGPCFVHFDGCNMDNEFVFSAYISQEHWEQDHEAMGTDDLDDHEVPNNPFDASDEVLPLVASRHVTSVDSPTGSAGWASAAVEDPPGAESDRYVALFQIGGRLAELGTELKQRSQTRPLVTTLNRDFANLRHSLAESPELVNPVIDRFCEDLDSACQDRGDLSDRCAEIQMLLLHFAETFRDTPCDD